MAHLRLPLNSNFLTRIGLFLVSTPSIPLNSKFLTELLRANSDLASRSELRHQRSKHYQNNHRGQKTFSETRPLPLGSDTPAQALIPTPSAPAPALVVPVPTPVPVVRPQNLATTDTAIVRLAMQAAHATDGSSD